MKVFLESLPLEYIKYNMLIHISFHHINISVTWSLCPANQARERVVNGEDDEEDDEAVPAAKVSACARVRVPHESARDTHTHINTHTHTHTHARARAHTHTHNMHTKAHGFAHGTPSGCITQTETHKQHTPCQHTNTHTIPHHMCGCWCITHMQPVVVRARVRACVNA